jgi:hypothetical protein
MFETTDPARSAVTSSNSPGKPIHLFGDVVEKCRSLITEKFTAHPTTSALACHLAVPLRSREQVRNLIALLRFTSTWPPSNATKIRCSELLLAAVAGRWCLTALNGCHQRTAGQPHIFRVLSPKITGCAVVSRSRLGLKMVHEVHWVN